MDQSPSAPFGQRLARAGHVAIALVNLTYELPDAVEREYDRLAGNIEGIFGDVGTAYAAAFLTACPPTRHDPEAVREVNQHLSVVGSHGYRLGLVRLHIENEVLGRTPRHTWREADPESAQPIVEQLAGEAWADVMRIQPWVSLAALDPFSDPDLMWAAIQYLALEDFKAIAHHYPEADPMPPLALPGITAIGYAVARAQQEPATAEHAARISQMVSESLGSTQSQ